MSTHGKFCDLYKDVILQDKILEFIRMYIQLFSFLLKYLENDLTKEKKKF